MADEAKVGDEDEEEEDPESRAQFLNPELLSSCMRNDTEMAVSLIEQQADPCCEDDRQWTPLVWAASHGNIQLTRLLISKGAAEMYKYDESHTGKKKKHSPLHWAAFKGHLKMLWILMAPPHSLSHHEQDAIGNTALHQAAAGGSLECVKCLMAYGCDVLAKNNRGHTPNVLCTVPEVQELLRNAENSHTCKAPGCGKQFSSTVLRYLCSWSLDVFCDAHVTQTRVYEDPEATEMEKPVTWCNEVRNTIQEAESQLNHALHLHVHMSQLEAITTALEFADNKPVDCKLVDQCEQIKAKLEAEIELGNAMQVQTVTNLEEFGAIHENLTRAIEDAEVKNAEVKRVDAAKSLRRKLMAEASLMRAVNGPQKTTTGHIAMLEELSLAAEAEGANEDLLKVATNLTKKIKSEREVQARIAEAAPLCKLNHFWEAEKTQEPLPAWTEDIEAFDTFHEEYKQIVETGEEAEISKELQATALEQLGQIELLLVEKKQIEEEKKLKEAKKKKGKK